MTAELLVNVTPSETRVAYIDGGILQEIHIEREARRGIVGNIYKGRVSRVLPGMQAAFVDIGLDKAAFLHASDIMPHTECVAGEEQKQFTVRDISELVRQGQDLMVQVVKDPSASVSDYTVTFQNNGIQLPGKSLLTMELGKIYTVDVYFYLEGCDPDCSDSVSFDQSELYLGFYGVLSQGAGN